MNKERLLELARDLRENNLPTYRGHCTHFDMRRFFEVPREYNSESGMRFNFCGTIACLAGMAALKWGEGFKNLEVKVAESWDVKSEAREVLDLDHDTANKLFLPKWLDQQMGAREGGPSTDAALAARVIERLVDTGEVDWEQGEENNGDE